jgi:hypothetical protein
LHVTAATSLGGKQALAQRLETLFEGLTGQRNAMDGRIVEIVAELTATNCAG